MNARAGTRKLPGHLQQALRIYRELGNRSGEAYMLTGPGLAYLGSGRHRPT